MSRATDDAPAATAKSSEQKKEAATDIKGAGHESLIGKSVTINRPRAELFAYWRDFTQLPSFMDNVERVDVIAAERSHWVVKAPAGKTVEWDAVITEEIDGELIAWASVEGADVPNSGRIEFRDAGERGTIVTATIAYDPPAGFIGKIVAKMFQREPAIQARSATLQAAHGNRRGRHCRPHCTATCRGEELMRALTWHGKHDVRVDTVDDPEILNPRDAIIKISSTAICGSDLHLYDGYIPTMKAGDILGHEFMGEVVETGAKSTLKKGQRVVVPFTIACGSCYHCAKHQYSACDNGNPADNQDIGQEMYGQPMSGLFGYSHLTGGYAGGQAEYVRVPFSDVGPIVVPDGLEDDQVLFLSDILPTGWQAAEYADIEPGDTVAIWGCGPVGLFAVQSAFLMGAQRVIAIDHFPHRLELAKRFGAETINYEETKTYEALMEMTGGIGPDAVIDAVGLEAHGFFLDNVVDQIKASMFLGTDRTHSIRQAIHACRKGGRVSMPAVYGGFVDKFPLGAFMEKGLTLKTGQTSVQHYMPPLLNAIVEGKIDTTFLISHRMGLEDAPKGYKMFHDQQNEVTKIVLKPAFDRVAA